MRDDHTLETENGAAAPADRSTETPSAERSGTRLDRARRTWQRFADGTARTAHATAESLRRGGGATAESLRRGTAATADSLRPGVDRAAGVWTASRDRVTALPAYDKMRNVLGERGPARIAIATGVLACLGVAAAAEAGPAQPVDAKPGTVATAESAPAATPQITGGPPAAAAPAPQAPAPPAAAPAPGGAKGADKPRTEAQQTQPKAEAKAKAKPKAAKPVQPKPVAGLSQTQMNNAMQIVKAGEKRKLPERAMVIAVATAMQESQLLNLASDVVPESWDYPHQGSGSDHDSVGLFQQRSSVGWGSVKQLMNPSYSAGAFYDALVNVPGWQDMALTDAAQAVQYSAFPGHYAKHEDRAQAVVDALTD